MEYINNMHWNLGNLSQNKPLYVVRNTDMYLDLDNLLNFVKNIIMTHMKSPINQFIFIATIYYTESELGQFPYYTIPEEELHLY